MNKEQAKKFVELEEQSDSMNDFAKKGCGMGLFVSMSQGRRLWEFMDKIREKGKSDAQDAGHKQGG